MMYKKGKSCWVDRENKRKKIEVFRCRRTTVFEVIYMFNTNPLWWQSVTENVVLESSDSISISENIPSCLSDSHKSLTLSTAQLRASKMMKGKEH